METTESLTHWDIRNKKFAWGSQSYIMAILNITPDSFSDGGEFLNPEDGVQQALTLKQLGADLIDIGGQSSRPNAEEISVQEEIDRILPIIHEFRHRDRETPISVDTTRSDVASAAIAAGADIINDISGGTDDPHILTVAATHQVPIILMHRRGTSKTMQSLTHYDDLIGDILSFLRTQIERCLAAGISRHHIAIDPGIGFAKTSTQNIELLQKLPAFQQLNCPILIGTSRKSFIGQILDQSDPKQRVWGTAATCCAAIASGADILRVHDVDEMRQVCRMADVIWRSP